ncbi:MAG: hypothetical protein EPN97_16585 [Alphaproteobacteria bacterium]|nr:MAG: hypothetical protein EPN97_16585 [Alphaproteobacteria bacterium]
MRDDPERKFGEGFKSWFRNDGDNPLAALGMVFALGVVPMAIAAGVIGGIGWLGYLGVKAAITMVTTGSLAGILSPAAALGTVVGGAAVLAAGAYTGVTEALWRQFSMKVLRRPDPDNYQYAQQEAPSAAWQELIKEKNARNGFENAAKKDAAPAANPVSPSPGSPKPPVNGGP